MLVKGIIFLKVVTFCSSVTVSAAPFQLGLYQRYKNTVGVQQNLLNITMLPTCKEESMGVVRGSVSSRIISVVILTILKIYVIIFSSECIL